MDDVAPARSAGTPKPLAPPELRGKRVTVMGLGSFGGGAGAVQFLVERGASVTVTDLRDESALTEALSAFDTFPPVACHLGGHREEDFTNTDLVVVNPAVPKPNPFVALAVQAGVPVTSEMNLFWQFNQGKTVGITGSNGKSTTTAMTHALLTADGRQTWLGGNLGGSLLPVVDQIQPDDWVVLELSSFQLEDLDALRVSPDVAIVTNFTPNHLDRHGTLESYRQAKQTILRWQTKEQLAVLNSDDPDVANWATNGRTLWFGTNNRGNPGLYGTGDAIFHEGQEQISLPIRDWLTLPGAHNFQNALGASCAALALGASADAVREGLRHYRALPHRLEFIAEAAGRQFFNDSLATTPESTQVALAAFSRPIVLLAGGYDKKSDLNEMARAIAYKPVKAVALMGQTGPALRAAIERFDTAGSVTTHCCGDFAEAFRWSVAASAPGDVVLLSPGCASYDWFRNFADRGEQFRKLVLDWQQTVG